MSAKHVMIVSDSCYSGRLTRGLSVAVKTGAEREAELSRLAAKRSRTALVSGGLEPVNDGGGEGHSVFTRAFLTALRESTEVLDGQQLFAAVRRPVIVNADQTPEYSDIRLAGHDGGDFLFVPVSLGATATVREAPAAQDSGAVSIDIQVWTAIQGSTNPADFEAFIETFPSSPMVGFARNKLEALAGVEAALAVPDDAKPKVPAASLEGADELNENVESPPSEVATATLTEAAIGRTVPRIAALKPGSAFRYECGGNEWLEAIVTSATSSRWRGSTRGTVALAFGFISLSFRDETEFSDQRRVVGQATTSLVSGSLEDFQKLVVGSKHEAWYRWRAKGFGSDEILHQVEVVEQFEVETSHFGTQIVFLVQENSRGRGRSGSIKHYFAPSF